MYTNNHTHTRVTNKYTRVQRLIRNKHTCRAEGSEHTMTELAAMVYTNFIIWFSFVEPVNSEAETLEPEDTTD
jgi:hypothetical protein